MADSSPEDLKYLIRGRARVSTAKVFVPGGLPTFTYNSRPQLGLEDRVRNYLSERHRILSVSGPTKTGKTVLLRSVLDDPIWLAGGEIDSGDDFWAQIADQLGVFTEESVSDSSGDTMTQTRDGKVNLGIVSGGLVGSESTSSTTGSSRARTRPIGVATRDALATNLRTLVIDDFHYIDSDTQVKIVRGLKSLIFDGLAVIVASIPHRAFDAVRVEKEMTGRVEHMPIAFWSEPELVRIGRTGFASLRAKDPGGRIASRLSKESFSSPHLMQEFCLSVCKGNGVTREDIKPSTLEVLDWDTFFRTHGSTTSKAVFDLLAQGPRQRSDRRQRDLATGETTDIYGLVLQAISETGPSTEVSYDSLRRAITDLLAEKPPQRHETTRVLDEMTKIARDHSDGEPVLEYESEGSTLYISDPFFAYYLRWGQQQSP